MYHGRGISSINEYIVVYKNESFFMQEDINICFLMGKITSEIEFRFFYNSNKHVSMVKFFVNTYKGNLQVLVKGYDEIADTIYKKFSINNSINFMGFVKNNEIIIKEIL